MPDAGDVERMRRIGRRLESWGVKVVWMPGWESRGGTWSRVPEGVIDHHDASTVKSGEWGALGYIVANNLSQFQVARCLDGVPKLAINAAGICYHAGVGGWRFEDGNTVGVNNGNYELYGAEKAHGGTAGEPITEAAHYAADALYAAITLECALPKRRVVMHKEYGNTPPGGWPGRKTDPVYPGDWRRDRVANFTPRTGTLVEDDMFEDKDRANLARLLTLMERQKTGIPGVQVAGDAGALHHRTEQTVTKLRAEVAALRSIVAADKGIDEAQVERVIRDAIADSIVTVDVNVGGQPNPNG